MKRVLKISKRLPNAGSFQKGQTTGDKNVNYRGYIINQNGYRSRFNPTHHFADSKGYVREHRLVYEACWKCCLLPWAVVHHKNGIKTDNHIDNLDITDNSKHTSRHMIGNNYSFFLRKNFSERFCVLCGGKTSTQNRNGYLTERWHKTHQPDRFMCSSCYDKKRRSMVPL